MQVRCLKSACPKESHLLQILQSQVGLVLVLVLPGHQGHDQHVKEHQTGEEKEGVGLEKRSRV